jgi:hypothetical protein
VEGKVSLNILENKDKGTLQVTVDLPTEHILEQASNNEGLEKINVTIPISSGTITSLLQSEEVTKVNIKVNLPSSLQSDDRIQLTDLLLDGDILDAAKKAKKDVEISVVDEKGKVKFEWAFSGNDLTNSELDITDVNLSLEVSSVTDNKQVLELLKKDKVYEENTTNSLIIRFNHHGVLPAPASVRIFVGDMDIKAEEKVFLYYFNSDTGLLETLPYSSGYQIDKDGYITINLLHCSDYVMLPKRADYSVITSLRKQIKVTPTKKTLYLGEGSNNTTSIQIELPLTLELVNNLKDRTSSIVVGAATVTFKSNNNKVATVSSVGKIIAKGVGTAIITTKITLYSGKVKITTTTITVYADDAYED